MKKILLLCLFLNFLFSSEIKNGYVWVGTNMTIYDNLYNKSYNDMFPIAYNFPKLPEINSIIEIPKNNIIYTNFNVIKDIKVKFKELLSNKTCKMNQFIFSYFMLNYNPDLEDIEYNCFVSNYIKNDYFIIDKTINAKILGYETIKYGTFIFVQLEE